VITTVHTDKELLLFQCQIFIGNVD